MSVRRVQLANAPLPMYVTELLIETVLRLPHPRKAKPPICVTELGMMMEESLSQNLKAWLPMDDTEFGITVLLHPIINSLVAVSIIALQLLRES